MLHIALHIMVPLFIAGIFFRACWRYAAMVMIATMLVDLDHLLATPIYDPGRCSIGFHPLHQLWFIGLYGLLLCFPKTRVIGLGLCVHMSLDAIDCQLTNGLWIT